MRTDYLTMGDLARDNKRVLVRVDFNSPLDANGDILDDTKLATELIVSQSNLRRRHIQFLRKRCYKVS
jgi:3-phosphoglycerate kinase